jgi:hypothetical protein
MSSARLEQKGATRVCPHCKTTVLASSSVCPACRHHLRFNVGAKQEISGYVALKVDGTFRHRNNQEPCEYCVMLTVDNERGERVIRQVVNVGFLKPTESRTLSVSVEVMPPQK